MEAGHRLGARLAELFGHLVERHRQRELVDHHRGVMALLQHLVASEAFGVATEEDVDASACHVGGHRDRMQSTGLGDDLRLTRVLLGVEHLVLDAALRELA